MTKKLSNLFFSFVNKKKNLILMFGERGKFYFLFIRRVATKLNTIMLSF